MIFNGFLLLLFVLFLCMVGLNLNLYHTMKMMIVIILYDAKDVMNLIVMTGHSI